MNPATITHMLDVTQILLGALITLAGLGLLTFGTDPGTTHARTRWALVGLVGWGAWLGLHAYTGRGHDSPPALAFAALVAWVLVRHGRQVAAIIEGASWWPPHRTAPFVLTVYQSPRRPLIPWWRKLDPWWLLIGNVDDGLHGDDKWRAGRPKTLKLALIWWFRNPAHNLTWYALGVADRDRLTVGRWGGEFHRPGGGWLTAYTVVDVGPVTLRLPFLSYVSRYIKGYAGWRPSGSFGFKLNISRKGLIDVPGGQR